MATQIGTMLAAASAQTVPVVWGIRDDQLGHPTPCDDFQVRDLFNHLYQIVVGFQELAAGKQPDFGTTPDELGGDWRGRFAEQADRLVEAWSDPGALEGVSPAMGMPQEAVGRLALLDLTVHGWDLARATGQRYAPDRTAVRLLTPLAEQMGPQAREMGVFDEPVEVAEDAGDFERLLALTGRRATL